MYKIKKSTKNKRSSRLPLLLAVAAVVVVAGLGFLYYRNQQDKKPSDEKEVVAANLESPVPDENGGETTPKQAPTNTGSSRDGGAVDTGGQDATNSGQSTSSASGNITVYSPSPDSVVKSGGTLSGAAKVSTVNYRLIDDKIGVIGTGILKVVSGRFSGRFEFQSGGQAGRLDVFRTLSDGREVDVVEIPVRYQ